ncbi:MAG: DUF5703 family protein [Bifidobacteriaceae bacterium]|nr:DUF5703 family protein [Bifidobacteriaceae bacterium]
MTPTDRWIAAGGTYDTRVVPLAATTPRAEAARYLTDEAEHGRWELHRTVTYWGGRRQAWLRRKSLRVESTLD